MVRKKGAEAVVRKKGAKAVIFQATLAVSSQRNRNRQLWLGVLGLGGNALPLNPEFEYTIIRFTQLNLASPQIILNTKKALIGTLK